MVVMSASQRAHFLGVAPMQPRKCHRMRLQSYSRASGKLRAVGCEKRYSSPFQGQYGCKETEGFTGHTHQNKCMKHLPYSASGLLGPCGYSLWVVLLSTVDFLDSLLLLPAFFSLCVAFSPT